jgi:hypothetical protein
VATEVDPVPAVPVVLEDDAAGEAEDDGEVELNEVPDEGDALEDTDEAADVEDVAAVDELADGEMLDDGLEEIDVLADGDALKDDGEVDGAADEAQPASAITAGRVSEMAHRGGFARNVMRMNLRRKSFYVIGGAQ